MRVAALLLAALTCAAGQSPEKPVAQQSPPLLRITVTLVQVDAVVTDSHGRRVTGLTPDDFEILQDGIPQKVSYFSYIPEMARPPRPAKGLDAPGGEPQPVAPGEVKRTIALVVDDLALSFDSLVRVRNALRKYVEEQMQPGDLVAIVRTGGGIALLEQFTTDKRLLLEAVNLLKWRFSGRAGLSQINPLPGANPPFGPQQKPEMLDYGYALSALGSLRTLEEVVGGMKQMPGRKSVVLLSDSLRVDPEISAAIQRLIDQANRSDVSIYAIDPRGLQTGVSAADAEVPNSDPARQRRTGQDQTPPQPAEDDAASPFSFPLPPGAGAIESVGGLSDLAKGTGGLFFANRNDIPDCIRDAAADQLGYYLLGYTPREGTFGADPAKAKFHRVSVRLRNKALRVRWKTGFEGVPDELTLTDLHQKTREQQLLEALASPFAAAGIKVRLTSIFAIGKSAGPFIHSMLYFDARGLTFEHDEKGNWRAAADVVTVSYRGLKQHTLQRQNVQQISLSDTMYKKALQEGFLLLIDDPMPEPGMFLMRVVVRDQASGRIGSASQFVVVPDTRKGRLALSGIMLQLATADVMRDAGVPLPPDARGGRVEEWSEGGPAMRRYRPGQNILYAYVVINPRLAGKEKLPQTTAQIRVFRNGRPFYTGPPQTRFFRRPDDPADFVAAGILRLGPQLTPGEYLVEITVTDPLAKKKHSQASDWTDFEVVNADTTASNHQ